LSGEKSEKQETQLSLFNLPGETIEHLCSDFSSQHSDTHSVSGNKHLKNVHNLTESLIRALDGQLWVKMQLSSCDL